MERTVQTPLGPMPGETFARLVAFDGLVHGYDIATASGVPYALPDCVVEAVDGFAALARCTDEQITAFFDHFAARLADEAAFAPIEWTR